MSDEEKTVTVVVGFPSGKSITITANAHSPLSEENGHLKVMGIYGYPVSIVAPGYWTSTVVHENVQDDEDEQK